MEAAFGLDVPDMKVSPDMMPLFKRQYDNHIFTGSVGSREIVILIINRLTFLMKT